MELGQQSLKVLRFISDYTEAHGFAPSLPEMAQAVGISQSAGALWHVKRLEAQGLLTRYKRVARSYRLTDEGRKAL